MKGIILFDTRFFRIEQINKVEKILNRHYIIIGAPFPSTDYSVCKIIPLLESKGNT